MELTRPSSPTPRHWRLSIPISLGVVLLLTSLVIAAVSLRSHANNSSSSTNAASSEDSRWMSLGYADVPGGITPIYPLQPGRVKSIEAVENEVVKAGEPLFHLEDTIPRIKLREAQDALDAAKKQLAVAEARVQVVREQTAAQEKAVEAARKQVQQAQLQYDKQKQLQNSDIGSNTSVKNAELELDRAKLAVQGEEGKLNALKAGKREAEGYIEVARANIKGKQGLLEEAQNAVNETIIRAPCDGIPLRVLVSVGQVLGTNPHQPAIQFAPNRPLLVRAEVEQEFVGRVRKDQTVIIEDHVTTQECARGKVVSLARWYAHRRSSSPEMLQVGNDARTLECIIKIESTSNGQELRIGQRVRVQFPN